MGNAPARLAETKEAALRSAANVPTGDVSRDKSPSQLAAEISAIKAAAMLLGKGGKKIFGKVFDAIESGDDIPFAEAELLKEAATVIIANEAKGGNLAELEKMEAAGVPLDSPAEIEQYLAEQWLIRFDEIRELTHETENPKEAFVAVLTGETVVQTRELREEVPPAD